jgi:ATP-dependent Lhr-like helicase
VSSQDQEFAGGDRERLLSAIEQHELKLLSWGYVDGIVSAGEVEAVGISVGLDGVPALLRELVALKLIFEAPGGFRSRFATTVRLLARNRQLFHDRDWRASPSLIDAYRVASAPRRIADRNVDHATTATALGLDADPNAPGARALRALLSDGTLQLAGFQVRAAQRILTELRGGSRGTGSGTLVSAGTGGGKTKAFYLPLFIHLAEQASPPSRTVAVAIYPRNELLKDQLREAIRQSDLVHDALGWAPSIGAFFGPTRPKASGDYKYSSWSEPGGNAPRVSSYLVCPGVDCDAPLHWIAPYAEEQLVCPSCGWRSKTGQVRLSRDSIQSSPPQVLLTSIEMINRHLANAGTRSIVTGGQHPPEALLLDEAHLYTGIAGATAALTLRRWQHALHGHRPHVVGLSATLDRPREHLSGLTGVMQDDIEVISPFIDELKPQSAEHTILLRSDPTSGASTLSATVQAAFLVQRMMETSESLQHRSGTSGSRTFAFANSLDVVNRLRWALSDAENGARWPAREPLAWLRRDVGEDRRDRESEGQNWGAAASLSGPLEHRLTVSLTSSQSKGVDADADIVVASPSLEVGFDDPEVGAVIQHKMTPGSAAFIQRRGRAGRRAHMRPWTVVVLSDFGRDRASFLAFERLLEPVVPFNPLPTSSLFVLRVQATWALMDWLSTEISGLDAWRDLSSPSANQLVQGRQRDAIGLLARLLVDKQQRAKFARHVAASLQIESEQMLDAVMWGQPRGLMTSAVPTLLRQLRSDWRTASGNEDFLIRGTPLPTHAPGTTFADLNVPEVRISCESQPGDSQAEDPHSDEEFHDMPIDQAMSLLAPGNPTRRFGHRHYLEWHWVPPSIDDSPCPFPGVLDPLGVEVRDLATGTMVPLMRPYTAKLSRTTKREDQRWASRPVWSSAIRPSDGASMGNEVLVEIPASRNGNLAVAGITFMTHSLGCAPSISRGLIGARAVAHDGGRHAQTFAHAGERVAIGYHEPVDACSISPLASGDLPTAGSPALRALRTMHFNTAVLNWEPLREIQSDFELLGVLACLRQALAVTAYTSHEAFNAVKSDPQALLDAMRGVVESMRAPEHDDDFDRPGEIEQAGEGRDLGRQWQSLAAFIESDTRAGEAMLGAVNSALNPTASELTTLFGRSRRITLAAVVREALNHLNPNVGADDLHLDVDIEDLTKDGGGEHGILLCEQGVGSTGVLDALNHDILEDPRRFADLVEKAAGPTPLETADQTLAHLLRVAVAQPDGEVAAAFSAVRGATSIDGRVHALQSLRNLLHTLELPCPPEVVASLSLRVLRAGSDPESDAAVCRLLDAWHEIEATLELEVDPLEVAFAATSREQGAAEIDRAVSLLWPRGRLARQSSLNAWSRFNDDETDMLSDRLVLADRFTQRTESIDIAQDGWVAAVQTQLETGHVRLTAPTGESMRLARAALGLTCQAFDAGSVNAYARMVASGKLNDQPFIDLEIREVMR